MQSPVSAMTPGFFRCPGNSGAKDVNPFHYRIATRRPDIMARRRKNAGKPKKRVRCTFCSSHRWLGNAKGRFKAKDELEMRDDRRLEGE